MTRHKNADFTREATLVHWKRELVDLMIRSGLARYEPETEEQDDKNISTHTD